MFEDIDGSPHKADIEWLAAQGITKGINPPQNTLFGPNQPVTRGQMATFLRRYHNMATELSDGILAAIAELSAATDTLVTELGQSLDAINIVVADLVERVGALEDLTPPPTTPGQPTLYGITVLNNGDPTTTIGQPVDIQRMFFQWDHWNKPYFLNALGRCKAQQTLPWVSFKTPAWNEMASGARDTEIDRVLAALINFGEPAWVTFWHEPENDPGTAVAWRGMQARVRQRLDSFGQTQVKFVPILMSWTWDTRSGRNPNDWWVDDTFDFLGVDHYSDPNPTKPQTLLGPVWDKVRASADTWGVDIAVGELGLLGPSGDPIRAFYNEGGAKAYVYYNEDQVGVADWRLAGDRLAAVKEFL